MPHCPEVPDGLIGDPGRLRQVIVNLVGNAIKFTEVGEVVLDVGLERPTVDDDIELIFKVRDTGIGIPKGQQAAVFEAFTQADTSTTRRYGGTGLGLAISSQLVQLMEGRIWLESEVGRGTTFFFTARFKQVNKENRVSPPSLESLRGLHVLVVDDNETNRRIMSEILTNWQLTSRVVSGAGEALKELKRAAAAGTPYRLALLDCMMPDVDGFTLAQQIRSQVDLQTLSMIMVSSAARAGDSARCRELGISRYMTKPVVQSDLLDSILMLVEQGEVSPQNLDSLNPQSLTLPSLNILLAEDGYVNQRVAVGLLETAGHAVTVANDGREALKKWEEGTFDVILMDMQMPEMDGFEATGAIRSRELSRGTHTPIIALTAAAMKGDAERCLEAGMDAYVSKPIDPTVLFETIRLLINPSRLEPAKSRSSNDPSLDAAETPSLSSQETLRIIDFMAPQKIIPGGKAAIKKLAEVFVFEARQLLSELRVAVAAHDPMKIRRAAHTLKGSAALFAAERVRQIAFELESLGRLKELEFAEQRLAELEVAVAEMLAEVERFLQDTRS